MTTTKRGRRYSTATDPEPGWALRRAGRMQKHIASALDFSASHVSRMVNEAREGAVSRFLQTVQRLMEHDRTTPGPIIAEVMRAAHTAVRPYEAADLRELLYHVVEEEVRAQAAEDVATYELTQALEATQSDDASPEDLRRLADAQDAFDEAVRVEIGWEVVGLVVNHELRARSVDR